MKKNDYNFTENEKVIMQSLRDMFVQLTDKTLTDTIRRADLVCSIGVVATRINHLNKTIEKNNQN